jgi:hypothetical protein
MDQQTSRLPIDFCRELVAEISAKGERWLPLSDDRVEVALARMLTLIKDACRESLRSGDDSAVDAWLYLLDELSPDPTTGRHDLFWAYIRDLQPAFLGVGNPKYERADIARSTRREQSAVDYPENWREVIKQSAEGLYDQLRS